MVKEIMTANFDKDKFELLDCNGSDDTWDCVDKYIVDFLKELNKNKNVSTLFSCEGHKKNDTAYLLFKVNKIGWDIFWQQVLPSISYEFSSPNPNGSNWELNWYFRTFSNQNNTGISIHCDLTNIKFEEYVAVSWEEKKERFWNTMKEVFLSNFEA